MQGAGAIKIPEQQLNKNLLSGMKEAGNRRWVKVVGFVFTVIFTAVMLTASVLLWQYMLSTPMCQQRGTCLLNPNQGPSTTVNYPESMKGMSQ